MKPKHDLPLRVYVWRNSEGDLEISDASEPKTTVVQGTYECVQLIYPKKKK